MTTSWIRIAFVALTLGALPLGPSRAEPAPADCARLEDWPEYESAVESVELDDVPAATEAGRLLVARCPRSAAARSVLGRALALGDGTLEAITQLRLAHELAPQDDDIWWDLSELLSEVGEYGEAAELYGRLAEKHPEAGFYDRRRVEALEKAGDIDAAAARVRELVERGARGFGWRSLGELYYRYGHKAEAAAAFRRHLADEPSDALAWNSLGNSLDDAKPDKAVEAYLRALELEAVAHRGYIWTNLGLAYRKVGRYDKALEAASNAVVLEPDAYAFWHNLGVVHRDRDEPALAIRAFRKAVEIEPDFEQAWRQLAKLEAGRDEASAARSRAEQARPGTIPELQAVLDRHERAGTSELAVTVRRRLIELRSRLATLRTAARAHLDAGKPQDALAAVSEGLALDPRDAELLDLRRRALENQHGVALGPRAFDLMTRLRAKSYGDQGLEAFERGEHALAETLYRKSLDIDDGSAAVWYNLGLLESTRERFSESIAAYRRSLQLDPDAPGTWNNLGYSYFYAGEKGRAREAYRQAIRLRQDYERAWHNLAEVCHDLDDRACLIEAVERLRELGGELPEGVSDPRGSGRR